MLKKRLAVGFVIIWIAVLVGMVGIKEGHISFGKEKGNEPTAATTTSNNDSEMEMIHETEAIVEGKKIEDIQEGSDLAEKQELPTRETFIGNIDPFQESNICVYDGGEDNYKNIYNSVLQDITNWTSSGPAYIEYYLGDGQYTEMDAVVYVTSYALRENLGEDDSRYQTSYVSIYSDDKLIYTKRGGFNPKMRPEEVHLDITGCNFLRIEMNGAPMLYGAAVELGDVIIR